MRLLFRMIIGSEQSSLEEPKEKIRRSITNNNTARLRSRYLYRRCFEGAPIWTEYIPEAVADLPCHLITFPQGTNNPYTICLSLFSSSRASSSQASPRHDPILFSTSEARMGGRNRISDAYDRSLVTIQDRPIVTFVHTSTGASRIKERVLRRSNRAATSYLKGVTIQEICIQSPSFIVIQSKACVKR